MECREISDALREGYVFYGQCDDKKIRCVKLERGIDDRIETVAYGEGARLDDTIDFLELDIKRGGVSVQGCSGLAHGNQEYADLVDDWILKGGIIISCFDSNLRGINFFALDHSRNPKVWGFGKDFSKAYESLGVSLRAKLEGYAL